MQINLAAPYDALAIANEFLEMAARENRVIDPMKLQKLLYCAHGWYLALTGKPLLEEFIEAWPYGPVVPSVYHEFKKFGNNPITTRASRLGRNAAGSIDLVPHYADLTPYDRSVLENVWTAYKGFSGIQLSALTHKPGSAWDRVMRANPRRTGIDIPDEYIRSEFSEQLGTSAA